MSRIKESDWNTFKKLHKIVLNRFCEGVLKESSKILLNKSENPHQAYLELYRLLHDKDKVVARIFNDYRRSTAVLQLRLMNDQSLLTKDEKELFSPEVQNWLNINYGEDSED